LLRAVDDADLDVLFEHWTDEEANRMAAFTVENPHDRQAFGERWDRLRGNAAVISRVIEVDGAAAGVISSWENEGAREVTYWLGREHWGKGVATRALAEFLESVDTNRPVQAATVFDNVGSQRVLEKCGFRRVGEARGFANARGAEVDEVLFRLDA
jgi:RimJ/RimL family protein N-acetyltransferase